MFKVPLPNPSLRTGKKYVFVEDEARVKVVVDWLPAGPLYDDDDEQVGERPYDTLHFIAVEGGNRFVRPEDIIDVSG
jgi:hypothetical protein